MHVPLNTDVSFTSLQPLQPLKKEAAHMHEQFKMDKWQKRCGSVSCKTYSSLSHSNTYFNAVNEYERCFAEMAHLCRTDEISRCYFQNYPPSHTEELRWEPKERVMTLLCGKEKYFLESFVLSGKNRVKNR